MSEDVVLAFAHPEARAFATRPDGMSDRIMLRDHVVSVDIGAFQPERGRTQRLCFNVVVEVSEGGDVADDVDRILSYDRITEAISAELAVERLNLLETLAERIAARILAEPRARRIFIRIEKLDLGPGALGVEIVRVPGDLSVRQRADTRPMPVIVHLSNDALASPRLPEWIDGLAERRLPVVITVGLPDAPRPEAGASLPQRRIDLLAIAQNAWRLAARDDRCVVVESRTEIDWVRTRASICVWAPSKMVLDAVDGPKGTAPAELVPWLAQELGANTVVAVGENAGVSGAIHRPLGSTHLLP